MKDLILIMTLFITANIFADEVKDTPLAGTINDYSTLITNAYLECAPKAIAEIPTDGPKIEDPENLNVILSGNSVENGKLTYVFSLEQKKNENKKIIAITTDLNCTVLSAKHYDIQ